MTEKTVPAKKRAPIRHLTVSQKAEAIALWKSGTVTLDDLCKRFKKERTTFLRLFKEVGAEKGSTKAETEKKITAAVDAAILDDATAHAKKIKDTRDDHYRYMEAIVKLTWSIVVRAKQENRNPATYATDMKSLEMAMRVFKMGREEKYALLGIRDDDDSEDKPLPDLVVQELTAQDIQRLHEQSLMADDELGLNEELGDEDLISDIIKDEADERVEED